MCEIDFDGETCAVWKETEHTARKAHKCDACEQTIAVGDRYTKHRSLYDGRWWSEAICKPCNDDRRAFGKADGHMLMVPSSFFEYLSGCVDSWDHNDPWRPMLNRLRARMGRPEERCTCDDCQEVRHA